LGTSYSSCAGKRTDHQLAQRLIRTQDDATAIFTSGNGFYLDGAPGDPLRDSIGIHDSLGVSEVREAALGVATPDGCADHRAGITIFDSRILFSLHPGIMFRS
jgi:hypothetical protein